METLIMAKTPRKRKLKPQTLIEFKAWLSGVEEMHDDDWIPNATQWSLIKQRIDLVCDQVVDHPPQASQHHEDSRPSTVQPYVPPSVPMPGTAFDNVEVVGSTALPQRPPVTPSPMMDTGVTPDIDSSAGYTSGFE